MRRPEPGSQPPDSLSGAVIYMERVRALLDTIVRTQMEAIAAAAKAVVRTIEQDGLVYLFGTGHSHMLAEEGHYRAGGLAPVCPILNTSLMLHESAVTSTLFERMPGLGPILLSRYQITDKDTFFVFSNSGVNAAPVEAAMAAKERGATVIAVVALAYASQVAPRVHNKKLPDVADIVIDNQGVPGDALVEIGDTDLRTGPASTIAGAFILNAILTEAAWRLAAAGHTPPVYISANMAGATEHNMRLVVAYRRRNPHL